MCLCDERGFCATCAPTQTHRSSVQNRTITTTITLYVYATSNYILRYAYQTWKSVCTMTLRSCDFECARILPIWWDALRREKERLSDVFSVVLLAHMHIIIIIIVYAESCSVFGASPSSFCLYGNFISHAHAMPMHVYFSAPHTVQHHHRALLYRRICPCISRALIWTQTLTNREAHGIWRDCGVAAPNCCVCVPVCALLCFTHSHHLAGWWLSQASSKINCKIVLICT